MITFTIPGQPVPKGRPRGALPRKGDLLPGDDPKAIRFYTPARTKIYERKVGVCAKQAGVRPTDNEVAVSAKFYLKDRRKVDVDNLMKAVLDGLNRVAYADDKQVWAIQALRRIDPENPRAEVTITERAEG